MAFITNSNLNKLIGSIGMNVELTLELFLEQVYPSADVFYILNKFEAEYLFKYRSIIDDEEKFFAEFYKEIPEEEDTKQFVFNVGGKTKYHTLAECKFLNKDYIDFLIPVEIKEIDNENQNSLAVDEYRKWFRNHCFLEKMKNGELSNVQLISQFNLKYPQLYGFAPFDEGSSLLMVEQPNSLSEKLELSFDLKEFEKILVSLIEEHHYHFQSPVARAFSKFSYLSKKADDEIISKMTEIFTSNFVENYGLKELKLKFDIRERINRELISQLLEYLKWNYNLKEKSFDAITLENFGLECCSACNGKNVLFTV